MDKTIEAVLSFFFTILILSFFVGLATALAFYPYIIIPVGVVFVVGVLWSAIHVMMWD